MKRNRLLLVIILISLFLLIAPNVFSQELNLSMRFGTGLSIPSGLSSDDPDDNLTPGVYAPLYNLGFSFMFEDGISVGVDIYLSLHYELQLHGEFLYEFYFLDVLSAGIVGSLGFNMVGDNILETTGLGFKIGGQFAYAPDTTTRFGIRIYNNLSFGVADGNLLFYFTTPVYLFFSFGIKL
jgi:hypothetical protein